MTFDYDSLTPGVRALVCLLHKWGFTTTDSGDGVTNGALGMEGARPYPHVSMVADDPVGAALRLAKRLGLHGVKVVSVTQAFAEGECPSAPCIQMTFDPVDGVAVIDLMGLDDAMLAKVTR